MNIKKYFWSLNEKSLNEVAQILKNPGDSKFLERAYTLLSRCDNPKEVWQYINQDDFIGVWPQLRRYWAKKKQAEDFKAWWETIYEQLQQKGSKKSFPQGEPSAIFIKTGKLIREKRLTKKISQQDFARRAGMSQPDISAIEAGKKNITLETLGRLCKILGIKNIPFN